MKKHTFTMGILSALVLIFGVVLTGCGGDDKDDPPAQYTVTFNADGGTVDPATAKVESGKTTILPTPTKTDNTFDGWFTAGGTQFTAATPVTADITVTAKWTKKTTDPTDPKPAANPLVGTWIAKDKSRVIYFGSDDTLYRINDDDIVNTSNLKVKENTGTQISIEDDTGSYMYILQKNNTELLEKGDWGKYTYTQKLDGPKTVDAKFPLAGFWITSVGDDDLYARLFSQLDGAIFSQLEGEYKTYTYKVESGKISIGGDAATTYTITEGTADGTTLDIQINGKRDKLLILANTMKPIPFF